MKILILRLSSLGDIVLTQPVTSELRRSFPSAEIHYLTKPGFVDIVEAFGTVDQVINYEKSPGFHLELLKRRYDLVIDLHAKLSTYIIGILVPHTKLLRYKKQHSKRKIIVQKHLKQPGLSTVELYLNCLSKLPDLEVSPIMPVPKLIAPKDPSLVFEHDKPLLAIFPGATHQTKMLPVNKLHELIHRLGDAYRYIVLGTNAESYLGDLLCKDNKNCQNHCGHYSLPKLLAVLEQVDLVISNDSGPMHLAAALGKPQIAVFGATHPSLGFGPLNPKAIVISMDLECQPCSLHGEECCPLGHFNCLNTISVEALEQAVKQFIKC